MAIMAAETLGIDYDRVRPIVADTASVGYTHLTGGSRVTFATGMAVVDTTKKIFQELCIRAAKMLDVDPEGVVWEDGCARPASSNVGDFKPLSLREIAAKRAQTGGPMMVNKPRSRITVGFHRFGVVLATPFLVGAATAAIVQWWNPRRW